MHRFIRFAAALVVTMSMLLVVNIGTTPASAGTMQTYLVLYKGNTVAANAITAAGGTLVYAYNQIGVAIARSDSAAFAANVVQDSRVEGATATARFGVRIGEAAPTTESSAPGDLPNAPAADTDNLSGLQWDMRQIHTPEAHAITGGSPAVVVGDIDTGLDFTHPDLAPNYDAAHSADCTSGAPQPLVAGNDKNGHGTHTAGTIAAAANGIGIVGVAPNVKIAGIKAGNDAGFFFPEAVICAFIWAGNTHVDVTNNSYFADPFLFNCRNDPDQRAIWKAEQRAIRYALNQGVTVVAAMGNESEDLAHPSADATSPDNATPVPRDVTNACVVIPVEIAGVIGVSAVGNQYQLNSQGQPDPSLGYLKSFYSNVGVGVTQITAPGGDSVFGRTAQAPNGRVLSSWPAAAIANCAAARRVTDPGSPGALWCYQQGTSMASPHVAGVAALIVSRYGNLKNSQNGKMRPEQVKAYLGQTADSQPCPTLLPPTYESFFGVGTESGTFAPCQGGVGNNSWYGKGQVNALSAVTR